MRSLLIILLSLANFIGLVGSVRAETQMLTLGSHGLKAQANFVTPVLKSNQDVIILLHGTLAHKDMELITTLQALLADYDMATLAINLTLGIDDRSGAYDCGQGHSHRHEDALQELSAWVEWLKGKGYARVSLLGHSRGGNQAAQFAQHNDAIESLILLAPVANKSSPDAVQTYSKNYAVDMQALIKKSENLIAEGRGDDMMALPQFLYCKDTQATAAAIVSYYHYDPDWSTEGAVSTVTKPILILGGTEDHIVPDVAKTYASAAKKDHITLHMIDDADHFFIDFYAEDVADSIMDFMNMHKSN